MATKSTDRLDEHFNSSLEDYDLLENPGHLMRRVQQISAASYTREVGCSLRSRQFSILLTLHQRPGLRQVELMDQIGMDRSTISDIVSRLEKKKLLARRKENGDDRTANLYITDKGLAEVEKALPGVKRMEHDLLDRLPKRLHRPFIEALKKIAESE